MFYQKPEKEETKASGSSQFTRLRDLLLVRLGTGHTLLLPLLSKKAAGSGHKAQAGYI